MPVVLELAQRQRRVLWWLLAITVIVRLATLGAYPLPDPSESRYAEMARKMLETGNWLVPQFDYGTPFWGKPPLSFWLTAVSMKVFGVNEFAARLPSALMMIGCGVLVHALAHSAAGRAAALLRKAGYEKATAVTGGTAAWREAQLPIVKEDVKADAKTDTKTT